MAVIKFICAMTEILGEEKNKLSKDNNRKIKKLLKGPAKAMNRTELGRKDLFKQPISIPAGDKEKLRDRPKIRIKMRCVIS